MASEPTPRALFIEKEKQETTFGISFFIDEESRELTGIKIHGLEKFPCTKNELIGWIETAKIQLIIKPEQEENVLEGDDNAVEN